MLQLQLLGRFRLSRDGVEIAVSAAKQRALLAVLACEAPDAISRDRLVDLLWGEKDQAHARQSLRQALSRLRTQIGEDIFAASAETVAIAPGLLDCDHTALMSLPRDAALDKLEGASARWHGDLLDGFAIREPRFDEWLAARRRDSLDRVIGVRKRIAELRLASGDAAGALPAARAAAAQDPLREDVQVILIRALDAAGQTVEALRQADIFADLLKRELEAVPGDETAALVRRVREKSQGRRTAREPDPPVETTTTTEGPPALAVLSFTAIDGDQALDLIGRRLADIAIMELSANPVLRVIDRASSFAEELAGADPVTAAKTLGADIVATGTLRAIGDGRTRLALALHWAGSATPFWTDRFAVSLETVAPLGDDLLSRVCGALGLNVEHAIIGAAAARATDSPRALDHFLRGVDHHHRHEKTDFLQARAAFAAALELDPGFGRAEAGLSISYMREWFWRSDEAALLDTALSHARRAARLAPHDAWAQTALGVALLYRRSFSEALAAFDRAHDLAPYDAYVTSRVGLGHLYDGNPEYAAELFARSLRLDPLHADRQTGFRGHALLLADRFGEAEAVLREIEAPVIWEIAWLAAAQAADGRLDEASHTTERLLATFRPEQRLYDVRMRPYRREADFAKLRNYLAAAGLLEHISLEGA